MGNFALAVHGGAGTILRSTMTPDLEAEYRGGLEAALKAGGNVLQAGGNAMDAVEAAVCSLEGFHLFNAGHGAVFTSEGKNELDASIMDGKTLSAGAVAFVRNIKNPIKLARLVMEKTEHVLLAGEGGNKFAEQAGVEFADDSYFYTEHRWRQVQDAIAAGRVQLDHAGIATAAAQTETRPATSKASIDPRSKIQNSKSLGTVGAVACDVNGDLASATSTGGMTNKKFGRIGDTALIGSGTYAENGVCAVSCTGHGEFFMLGVTAYDVAARMKYKGIDLETAAKETIERLTEIGGEGGLIAVDASGKVTLPFNSDGMYRGYLCDGEPHIEIYK